MNIIDVHYVSLLFLMRTIKEDMVNYIVSKYEESPEGVLETNMFGKSLSDIVGEGFLTFEIATGLLSIKRQIARVERPA